MMNIITVLANPANNSVIDIPITDIREQLCLRSYLCVRNAWEQVHLEHRKQHPRPIRIEQKQ